MYCGAACGIGKGGRTKMQTLLLWCVSLYTERILNGMLVVCEKWELTASGTVCAYPWARRGCVQEPKVRKICGGGHKLATRCETSGADEERGSAYEDCEYVVKTAQWKHRAYTYATHAKNKERVAAQRPSKATQCQRVVVVLH